MKVLQAERKGAKAESDSAIERLRTDIEKGVNSINTRVTNVVAVAVAILGVSIAAFAIFK
ncbi:MAG: hypothetical protein OXF05_05970 [Hyphomicrobiales bacterium]|nr:hypothetical protein [Hyphomicrobiales bacterium]